MRSKENRKNKSWKNPGSKDQAERDGPGESVVATHSCYVQPEILNEAKREIFTEVKVSKDKFPSPFNLKSLYRCPNGFGY